LELSKKRNFDEISIEEGPTTKKLQSITTHEEIPLSKKGKPKQPINLEKSKEYLLTEQQLKDNDYPLPQSTEITSKPIPTKGFQDIC
jgi:hypothetical protein